MSEKNADQLVMEIRERLAALDALRIPEAEKRAHLENVRAIIAIHYLSGKEAKE